MTARRVPGCFACEAPILPVPMTAVGPDDDLALCSHHFAWWVKRWLNDDGEAEPPCSAHLIEAEPLLSGEGSIVRCPACTSTLVVLGEAALTHHDDGSHSVTPKASESETGGRA